MTFVENKTKSMVFDTRGQVVALREGAKDHPLEGEHWVIGSNPRCDIVISDPYVSHVHCSLERRDGVLIVRDEGSRNGTRINGNPVEVAELRLGSYICVGRTNLVAIGKSSSTPVPALEALRGSDPEFRATIETALRVATSDCNVLVVGETGTGKDLISRAIHEASHRADERFVAVNCGAIPRELIGSELFGHDKGAFTGAHADRQGYFSEANRGTLFLDEIAELPIELQPNLLRAIETKRVRRVGGSNEVAVDVRIVAATNRIENLGSDGSRLRVDLYHRLATVVLMLPPLRDRMADVPVLVSAMLEDLAPEYGEKHVSEAAWKTLTSYGWPGNVRELRQAVARAAALGGHDLEPRDFFTDTTIASRARATTLLEDEPGNLTPYQLMLRSSMLQALQAHGTIRAAASHLGIPKSTFADKAKTWGLVPRRKPRLPK